MFWSYNNLDGIVSYCGLVVAYTTPQGWRAALSHPNGDNPLRAVRMAIWRADKSATAEDISKLASEELERFEKYW